MPRQSRSSGKEPAPPPSRPRNLEPATEAEEDEHLKRACLLSAADAAEDSKIDSDPTVEGQSSGRRREEHEESPAARPSNVPATTSSGLDGPADQTHGYMPSMNRVTFAELMERGGLPSSDSDGDLSLFGDDSDAESHTGSESSVPAGASTEGHAGGVHEQAEPATDLDRPTLPNAHGLPSPIPSINVVRMQDLLLRAGQNKQEEHSARTSARGAPARSAGARASASTSASGAGARSAARRRMSRCRTGWRSSEKVLIIAPQLVEVHSTHLADGTQCCSTCGGAAVTGGSLVFLSSLVFSA